MGIAWYRDLSIVIVGLLCLIIMVAMLVAGLFLFLKARRIIARGRKIQNKIEDSLGAGNLGPILGYATTIAIIGGYTYLAIKSHRRNKSR